MAYPGPPGGAHVRGPRPPNKSAPPTCPLLYQAGSHFNEDQHLEAGSKGVEFAKLAGSEEEASAAIKATAAASGSS